LKILAIDIETAPNLVHVWGLWQQNVGIPQIIDSGYVMCWSAKWVGEEEIMFSSIHHDGREEMLKKVHELLDEADAVIHYNGTKFDIPTLNKEFLLDGLTPPSPVKEIDLLRTARSRFRFPSNKLDYISQALGLGKKLKHAGHELWIACMNDDPAAWQQMKDYNIQDVVLLEAVYYKLRPWIKGHANFGLYKETAQVCPNCGGTHYHRRGFSFTASCKYQRYQCMDCGTWFRSTKNEGPKAGEKFVGV
jgi:DNA polymerase elongation subunit (family B)